MSNNVVTRVYACNAIIAMQDGSATNAFYYLQQLALMGFITWDDFAWWTGGTK